MAKIRANGEGSIRKRSDGRWEGRYTVGYDENGKVKMKNVLGKTQAEVKEKLKEKIEESKVLDVAKSESYTVAEWATLWFEIYAKPNISERTADYYNRYITKHIVPCLGDIKLNKLTGRQIQKMYNDLLGHGRERVSQKDKNPGLSGTYVHGVHVMLHNCLNRAVKERLIVRNPAEDVIVPKIDKKEMKILPPEQVKAYLKAAGDRGVLPLFYLELTSGLRKGEIAALLRSDLDVENCTLSVTKQLVSSRDGKLKITQPKTATSVRLISLPQETVELLKEEHAKHPLNIYMFPSPRTGGMYHPDSIVKLHEKILNDAGIEHLRFHDLRHSFATYALQSGADVKTLSCMLGHYSAGFTLNTYCHATRDMQADAARKIGGFSCPRKQGSGKKEHSQTQKAPGKNCPVLSAPIRIWVTVWVRGHFRGFYVHVRPN